MGSTRGDDIISSKTIPISVNVVNPKDEKNLNLAIFETKEDAEKVLQEIVIKGKKWLEDNPNAVPWFAQASLWNYDTFKIVEANIVCQ